MVSSILPLKVTAASVRRRGKRLIGPVDVAIGTTGLTVVLGPNGSGKTTLLRLMHGLERAHSGSVAWSVPEVEARHRQAYVFQSPIMMRRSVIDSIAFPLIAHGTKKAIARKKASIWARRIGLGEALDRSAPVLSGGEKQKLSIARALIRRPEILFLDEPCANLDGRATREIETILSDAHDRGTRIVMSTHDMGQARRLATDVVFMYRGLVHEAGSAQDFFQDPGTGEGSAFLKGDIVE
ncbi:MAG: ATP-binding cassette domain-containing protein [Rhodobacteraceae bacterium]|nr:ATP-binding cassette domain-containing protein [Paracoccaceae bacterium]